MNGAAWFTVRNSSPSNVVTLVVVHHEGAAGQHGLLAISEVIDVTRIALVAACAGILQVGARNMQNYSLLREVGRQSKPVLLKRGVSATVEELLLSAKYIMSEGNYNVILCARGGSGWRGRPADRGPPRPGPRPERRGAIALARSVRGTDGAVADYRPGGRAGDLRSTCRTDRLIRHTRCGRTGLDS